jgi:hypothetical protein
MLPQPFAPTNSVKHYIDPATNRVMYRVLSPTGATIAEAIDVESLARQIACMEELVNAFDSLLDSAVQDFWNHRKGLKRSLPTLAEIAEDVDGVYGRKYPNMPTRAGILVEHNKLQSYATRQLRSPALPSIYGPWKG